VAQNSVLVNMDVYIYYVSNNLYAYPKLFGFPVGLYVGLWCIVQVPWQIQRFYFGNSQIPGKVE
jgi:hypothetical protein